MNKVFMKKLLQAKRLQYEAIKEIIPEKMKDRIDTFEKEAFELIKDIVIEMIKDETKEKGSTDHKGEATYKSAKKVSVEFK